MSAQELAAKYIVAMEKTLRNVQRTTASVAVSKECIDEIFGYVEAYLEDAKYFLSQGKFETSLVSIAYCEGLLDALKLINAVNVSVTEKSVSY
jgi:hypothetical protein